MEKRIILTGSNGLLGQKIVNLLVERSTVDLIATSRGVNRHPVREGYLYESAELTDKIIWDQLFDDYKPTTLINTAAVTKVDDCEHKKELCDAVNTESVRYLARLCKKHGTHFVQISTDFVFDGEAGPYRESDPTGPVNYYGHSKLKAEQLLQSSGIPHTILRTILLYGVTPGMSRSNIVLWVKESLENKKQINIVNDQFRTPTLAEDLAHATLTAAMKGVMGTYHISGPELMSIFELALRVADFWQLNRELILPTDSDSLNQAAKRPPKTGFILMKAQSELEYHPHSFEQGLALLDKQLKEPGVVRGS